MAELPSKLFFRIGEVAGLVGVEPHVLRYWEREFRSIRPTKSAKGQRVYSRKDVENLLRVRDLLYRDGFTIAGAKKRMQRGVPEAALQLDAPEASGAYAAAHDGESAREAHDFVTERAISPSVASVSALAASEPPPSAGADAADVRDKLTALRAEVEAFLEELTTRSPSDDQASRPSAERRR